VVDWVLFFTILGNFGNKKTNDLFAFQIRGYLKITYFTQFKVLSEEFNPQNTMCIPVKFFFRLELEQTKQFSNSL
jgi:hypothetical protein